MMNFLYFFQPVVNKNAIFCNLEVYGGRCSINQPVDHEDYELKSSDDTVLEFKVSVDVKYLPRRIGEKLPSISHFVAQGCGLTILRSFYFKDMQRLFLLFLADNKIATIEPETFHDLIKVDWLDLNRNSIETLDENLFSTMVNIKILWLSDNKIKSLHSTTFNIPGASLDTLGLRSNVCIDTYFMPRPRGYYGPKKPGNNFIDEVESVIKTNCSSNNY